MTRNVRVLGVCSYGHGLNTATGRLYNRLITEWVLEHEREYDKILLVGSWVYRDPSRKPICVWQKETLICRGVSSEKICTLIDVDPSILLAMDTIEELWAMGMLLESRGYSRSLVSLYVVGMFYHIDRIWACISHIGAKVEKVFEVKTDGDQQSGILYEMCAWLGLLFARKGRGPILNLARFYRVLTTWSVTGIFSAKRIETHFWD